MSLTLGIDIGGTKIAAALVRNGEILKKVERVYQRSSIIDDLATAIKELDPEREVGSVGIACAGLIDSERGMITFAGNLDFENFPLRDLLAPQIDREISLTNDASAAGWGEFRYGAGRSFSHMALIAVGTGIGGGIVVNGNLYRGAFGIAAEFGHLRVVPDGHLCGCGARGCFEQYASGNALLRHAREAISASPEIARNLLSRGDGTVAGLTGKAITDAAREGDPVALAAFNTTGQWLGAGIASLSVLLDPACVVIGGGVIDAGEILLKPTREALERTMPFAGKHPYPTLIAAELGNEAGLVGVADLARA